MIARPEDTPEPSPGGNGHEPAKPGNNGHGGNGKMSPAERRKQAFEGPIGKNGINTLPKLERLAALNAMRASGEIDWATAKDRIPVAINSRMKTYLALIRGGRHVGEATKELGISASTLAHWRLRYPRFKMREQKAELTRTARLEARVMAEWEERAINGRPRTVNRKYDKTGKVVVAETITIDRSDVLLAKLIDRLFPEKDRGAGPVVTVNITPAEERREILVVVSDPDARAAIRRARDRALLSAGGAGESGDRGDRWPPA